MRIILEQDVKNIGKKFDVKTVSDGYAKNFLFPRKLAIPATESSLQSIERKKKQWNAEEEALIKKSKEQIQQLLNEKFVFHAKHNNGTIFGSIQSKDIEERLKEAGYLYAHIELKSPIKTLGEYEIPVLFVKNLKTTAKIVVKGE